MTTLRINELVFDDTCYPRVRRDDARVKQLADLLEAGAELPPILVDKDTLVVLGGWHTVGAYEARDAATVPVKYVTIRDDDRLLFAYQQDVSAALPYQDVDVRKVARLEYDRRCRNGGATVDQIATALGRPLSTVHRWIADLVERKEQEREQQRNVRVVVVQAFLAVGVRPQQIAGFVGVTERQVRSDSQVGITSHLNDSRIVSAAQSQIHLALGQGATRDEVDRATEWLLAQTQPELLAQARATRAANTIESDLVRTLEFLRHAAAVDLPPMVDRYTALIQPIDDVDALTAALRKQVQHANTGT